MKRLFKWILRLVGVASFIVAVALILYINWLPGFAEQKIVAALKDLGVDTASVQVRAIGRNHLQISDLHLASLPADSAGLRIGAVGVDYDLSLTGDFKLKSIDIVGAVMQLNLREGKLDLGPLANLNLPESKEPADADADLPFNRVTLRSCSLLVDYDGKRLALPIEATIDHRGKGVCDIAAKVQIAGLEVPLRGTVDVSAPAKNAPATGRRAADGFAFTLHADLLDQPLMIVGTAGGADGAVHATLKPVATAEAFEKETTQLTVTSDAAQSAIRFHAQGAPRTLARDIAGQKFSASDVKYAFDAMLDLKEVTLSIALDAEASAMVLASELSSTTLIAPRIKAELTGAMHDEQFVLSLTKGDIVSFASATAQQGDDITTIGGLALHAEELTLALITGKPRSDPLPLLRANVSTSPLSVKNKSVDTGVKAVILRAELGHAKGSTIPYTSSITIVDAHLVLPGPKIAFTGINAEIPLTQDLSAKSKPSLTMDDIRWENSTYPAPTSRVFFEDGLLRIGTEWPILDGLSALTADAVLDLSGGLPKGTIAARMQNVHITDDEQLGRLVPPIAGWRIAGKFDLTAEIALDGLRLVPDLRLVVRDGSASNTRSDAAFTGIDANLRLDSFFPVSTPPDQRLSVKTGHIGKMKLTNAVAVFRVESLQSVNLELAAWRFGKQGRFWMHSARFNPAKPILQTQVFIEDMSIAEWLELLTDQQVKGEGWMYGRIPLRIDSDSEFVLTFGQGFLYAKPGKGYIQIEPGSEPSQYVVKSIADVFVGVEKEIQRHLIEAVHDYEFDRLQFDFYPKNNKLSCLVTTSGRGRVGAKAPIGGLEVNIDDFGSLLSKRLLRSANAPGAIDDSLERILGGK